MYANKVRNAKTGVFNMLLKVSYTNHTAEVITSYSNQDEAGVAIYNNPDAHEFFWYWLNPNGAIQSFCNPIADGYCWE